LLNFRVLFAITENQVLKNEKDLLNKHQTKNKKIILSYDIISIHFKEHLAIIIALVDFSLISGRLISACFNNFCK